MIEAGTTVGGRFVIDSRVGGGASGTVFAARDVQDRRKVAIKIQGPRTFESTRVFQREGEALRYDLDYAHELKGIPGIPSIYSHDEHEGRQYLVMEFIEGKTLSKLMQQNRPASPQFAASVVAQLCGILRQVHARGFVHRDIKPDNIMVGWEGDVWLLDLGHVAALDEKFSKGGTHGYAPPEQYTSKGHDVRSDVYALGAILFDMCVMRVPYRDHQGRPTRGAPQFPPGLLDSMNRTLRTLGLQMVALDPEQRLADVSAVLAALDPLLPRPGDARDPQAPDPDPAEWFRHGRHLTHRAT